MGLIFDSVNDRISASTNIVHVGTDTLSSAWDSSLRAQLPGSSGGTVIAGSSYARLSFTSAGYTNGIQFQHNPTSASYLINYSAYELHLGSYSTTHLKFKSSTVSEFMGALTIGGALTTTMTASRAIATGGSSELVASATTAAELGYVSGVTSAIQTQLNTLKTSPRSTTTTTLAVGDVGKTVAVSANIDVPNAVFAAGDVVSIYNDSASSVTITQGASFTLRLVGTATTGNRTLAQRGLCTIWFNSSSEGVITGGGLT